MQTSNSPTLSFAASLAPTAVNLSIIALEDGFGITTLYEGPRNATADIVAVHGLNTHPIETWRNGDVMWLADLLPKDLPNTRIMTYGYNSRLVGDTSMGRIRDFAKGLLNAVDDCRSGKEKERPLIFICHSLGGLVVKQALVLASQNPALRHLQLATFAIIFLATPHRGSSTADIVATVASVAKLVYPGKFQTQIVKSLQNDSFVLRDLADDFRHLHSKLRIVSYYELKSTRVGLRSSLIVRSNSAVLDIEGEEQIPMEATHSHICKFSGPNDKLYHTVCKKLQTLVEAAKNHCVAMSPRRIFDVPGLLAPCFTGRDSNLKSLQDILETSSLVETGKHDGSLFKRAAIHGMPGAGKTQLALKYASSYRELYSAVFFVSAASVPALNDGYERIVSLLDLPERSATEPGIKTRAARAWLEDNRSDDGKPWLLVVDNIHPDIDDGSETETNDNNAILRKLITEFLPREGCHPQGSLILTTRKPEAAKLAVGRNLDLCIELGAMNEEEAVDLLYRASGRMDDEGSALSIVKELGYLPLAINQAATFISVLELDFQLFLKYFREEKDKILGWNPDDPQQDASTFHIYRMAFNGLVKKSPVSADIFHIFSFLDPEEIPLDILAEGSVGLAGNSRLLEVIKSPVEYLTALAAIRSGSLAQQLEKGRNKAFWIHDLVQYLGRQWLNSDEQREWIERTIDIVNCAYPDTLDTYDSWERAKKYRKHGISCAKHAEDLNIQNLHLGDLMMRMSWFLRQTGDLTAAKQLALRAVDCTKVLCEGQQQHMNSISNLGLMYYSLSSFRDAQEYWEMALEMAKKLLGPGYVDTGIGNNLALIYYQQGRFKEAEKHHLQIYLRRKEVLGDYHPETLSAMGSLANSYHFQGRLEEALELKKRILDGRKKRLGDTHPETWGAIGSLATTFSDMGFLSAAEVLQAEVLKGREDQWGSTNPESLAAKGALSYTFYLQGRFDEAAVLQQQVLKERNILWTDNHVETLGAMKHLGNTCRRQGRLQEAATLQEHAVFGMECLLGKDNPEYLDALNDLATTYREQGLVVGAEKYERQVKSERERIWGPHHAEILRSMEALSRKHQGFAH